MRDFVSAMQAGDSAGVNMINADAAGRNRANQIKVSRLADKYAGGDEAAFPKLVAMAPEQAEGIRKALSGMNEQQLARIKDNNTKVAKMFSAAKTPEDFQLATQILTQNKIPVPKEATFDNRHLFIAEAQDLDSIISSTKPDWQVVESGAGDGQMEKQLVNMNTATPATTVSRLGERYAQFAPKAGGGGGGGSSAAQKYQEMLKLNFPEQVARGVAYGTFKTISDPATGSTTIVDIENNREIGRMAPTDPNDAFGVQQWQPTGQQQAPVTATNPQTGERLELRGNQWVPVQ